MSEFNLWSLHVQFIDTWWCLHVSMQDRSSLVQVTDCHLFRMNLKLIWVSETVMNTYHSDPHEQTSVRFNLTKILRKSTCHHIDGLMQERHNTIADALELHLSCTKPSIWGLFCSGLSELTHCGLVTPYGDRDLGQHWLRLWLVAWRHQAITWTNVDLPSVRSIGIHLSAILQEILQQSITKISWKITFLKFLWNLPGANELTSCHTSIYKKPVRPAHCCQCKSYLPGQTVQQTWVTEPTSYQTS